VGGAARGGRRAAAGAGAHAAVRPAELEGAERIFLDYLATGICVDGHPMEHMRARLDALGVASSADLQHYARRERIVVSGLVVARQHPATAKGTVFVLLEDEFGYMNVIVPRQLYQENREVVRHAPFLAVEGRFEREDAVMNIVGRRFRELTPDCAGAPYTSAPGTFTELFVTQYHRRIP
jgi:error-prone DNA polymerase